MPLLIQSCKISTKYVLISASKIIIQYTRPYKVPNSSHSFILHSVVTPKETVLSKFNPFKYCTPSMQMEMDAQSSSSSSNQKLPELTI